MLRMFHHDNHLLQGIIRQLHHEMDMLVLLLGEILIGLALAVDGTCQVIAAVADALYLRHFTQHGTYLQLTFRTQASFGHLIQIIGNLQLHAVTDILVLLHTAEHFVEIIILLRMQQVLHHSEHTAGTFGKKMYFLACLQDGQLCRRKHTARDKTQAIFLVLLLHWNNGTDRTFDKLHEPYQYQHVADIEASMECRKLEGYGHSRIFSTHHVLYEP